MKFLPSFHNPKTRGYSTYYAIVLVVVTGVVILNTFQVIHQNIIQNSMTFFEGYFSLFMLIRNEKVGREFLKHVAYVKSFTIS
ncbi:hypothetical protein [Candidatus Nitrosotalea bavarica]|uniref:hypothetical protein n=1 Tax=Candidatus Nitrosotalea bavarica TaxID=1903277 RepID=UPI000C7083D9|nr:hypothetical protein [Candidatus Nitrosotalea bavarica]